MDSRFIGLILNERYHITKTLGAGGMGIVLQAHDHFLDRDVAVKIIQPGYALAPAAMDAFTHEARTIARLEHPHILTVYDLGIAALENGNLLYLVMQLASGGTLAKRLEKGPISLPEAQQIMVCVCGALDYAHNQGVIHLDLKPLNILFDAHNTPLVADFGLAKMLQNATKVKADTSVGTLAYMPPEQLFGAQAGPYSDVYALGITLYEMLTGELPRREWNGSVHFEHSLPDNLLTAVQKATQSDPGQRYAKTSELSRTLVTIISPSSVENSRPKSAVYQQSPKNSVPMSVKSYSFAEVEARTGELRRRVEAGSLTKEEFQHQLRSLMSKDEQGRWWRIDSKGCWHVQDGDKWTQAPPPNQAISRPEISEFDRLIAELNDPKTPALRRAEIGLRIAELGDPRPGVLSSNGVPDFAWCEVPAGQFQMGGDPDASDAWKGSKFSLGYPFWITKYPVTWAQYEPFVTSGGYQERQYWTDTGWENKKATAKPRYWNDPKWHISNHPVVGVSWYEAYAFTRWLNEQKIIKPASAPRNYVIRLARECEWEKAARYPDGRLWPWGNKWDPTRLNWGERVIERTTAVGMFPHGANPTHGACDLIGNVDEWCLTLWATRCPAPTKELNDPAGQSARCARGSCYTAANLKTLRAAARGGIEPYYTLPINGFRVVVSIPLNGLTIGGELIRRLVHRAKGD